MSALGQLVVSLIAETAQFRASMEKASYIAQKNFNSIQRSAQTLVAGLGIYFSADMFASWIKGAIDAADALNDLSERTGIATDELSKLQYAAKLSDVSAEDFASNVIKLNRSIAETARGTGEAQKAFEAMGISVKTSSGQLRDTEEVLKDIAEQFSKYEDGANKTALATALFGRAGAALIPFLNSGREGLNRYAKELENLGGVIMPNAARKAAELNDNIDRLRASFSAAATDIGTGLAPYLTSLINDFLILRKNSDGLFETLATGLALGSRSTNLQTALRGIREELAQVGPWTSEYTINSLKRQEAILQEAIQVQALARATGDMSDQISRRMAAEERARQAAAKRTQAPALPETGKSAAKSDEAAKLIERQAQAVQKLTMSEEDLAVAEVFLAGATMQQLENSQRLADVLTKQRKAQEDLKSSTDQALELYREYRQLYEETATPVQKLADEEARLLELRQRLISNGYDVATVERMIAEARMNAFDRLFPPQTKDQLSELTELAKQFGTAISTAFEDAVIEGRGLRDIMRALEQDIIRIITRKLITEPLQKGIGDIISSAIGTPSGNFFSALFGGARASGGDVSQGRAYLVGEEGPELFVPQTSGLIVPNDKSTPFLPDTLAGLLREQLKSLSPDRSASSGEEPTVSALMKRLTGAIEERPVLLPGKVAEKSTSKLQPAAPITTRQSESLSQGSTSEPDAVSLSELTKRLAAVVAARPVVIVNEKRVGSELDAKPIKPVGDQKPLAVIPQRPPSPEPFDLREFIDQITAAIPERPGLIAPQPFLATPKTAYQDRARPEEPVRQNPTEPSEEFDTVLLSEITARLADLVSRSTFAELRNEPVKAPIDTSVSDRMIARDQLLPNQRALVSELTDEFALSLSKQQIAMPTEKTVTALSEPYPPTPRPRLEAEKTPEFNRREQPMPNQINVTNHFTITGTVDRRSQTQIAAAVGQGINRAVGRNT